MTVTDDSISNPTANPTLAELMERQTSRRVVLAGGLASAAAVFVGLNTSPAGATAARQATAGGVVQRRGHGPLLGFDPIAVSATDEVLVPPGYSYEVLWRWGDPIVPSGPAFSFDHPTRPPIKPSKSATSTTAWRSFPCGGDPAPAAYSRPDRGEPRGDPRRVVAPRRGHPVDRRQDGQVAGRPWRRHHRGRRGTAGKPGPDASTRAPSTRSATSSGSRTTATPRRARRAPPRNSRPLRIAPRGLCRNAQRSIGWPRTVNLR